MVVHLAHARAVEILGAEIHARLQRHVADGAVLLRLWRVVEAAGAVARDAAEQVRVVMVLAAKELLVVVQFHRQAHLVAGRAELGGLVERLQERLLVEVGLGLHELIVHPLQNRVGALGERVVGGLLDRVAAVADGAVQGGDGVADRASDAGVGSRVR